MCCRLVGGKTLATRGLVRGVREQGLIWMHKPDPAWCNLRFMMVVIRSPQTSVAQKIEASVRSRINYIDSS